MALEGLWCGDDLASFLSDKRDEWKWTILIVLPDVVTKKDVAMAVDAVKKKAKFPRFPEIRFEKFVEGKAAQVMHVGPYATEAATVEKLHRFVEESGHRHQLGYRPYQALIDNVKDKGGLVFWSSAEARDFHEIDAGLLGTVRVKTEPHPEAMLMTTGYTGLGGLYQEGRTSINPGELWDRLLHVSMVEQRPAPVLIGELALHGLNDADKDLHRLVTSLWVKERTKVGVLEALQSGHSYAAGDSHHHVQLRLDEFRVVSQGGAKSASIGDRLDPGAARDLTVLLSIKARDGGLHPVKVREIRSGQVVAHWTGETPFHAD